MLLGRWCGGGGGGESVCYKSALSVKVTQETSFFSTLHTGPLDHSHANVKMGEHLANIQIYAFGKIISNVG